MFHEAEMGEKEEIELVESPDNKVSKESEDDASMTLVSFCQDSSIMLSSGVSKRMPEFTEDNHDDGMDNIGINSLRAGGCF